MIGELVKIISGQHLSAKTEHLRDSSVLARSDVPYIHAIGCANTTPKQRSVVLLFLHDPTDIFFGELNITPRLQRPLTKPRARLLILGELVVSKACLAKALTALGWDMQGSPTSLADYSRLAIVFREDVLRVVRVMS